MSVVAPPPSQDSVIELDPSVGRKNPFYMSKSWLVWIIESLLPKLSAQAEIILSPDAEGGSLVNQNAAIAATPMAVGKLGAGTYRVTYYARKTRIDGVNSSLSVVLGWTEGGVPLTITGPAMAVDNLITPQSGSIMVTIDDDSALTYATLYASATPGNMLYKLEFLIEAV